MESREIRTRFLKYFEANGHTIVESSPLVPANDPTLLFTNAGMVQFKDVFLGLEERPYRRAATCQKCVRAGGKHNDLEQVGKTARHHTFFEMLGNFSFGDYFKREAIIYAWELITREFNIEPDRIWATIFRDDDEAFEYWRKDIGLPAERVVRLGEKDNFWEMGDVGPCGPTSELVYDRGEAFRCDAPECAIGKCDCDRWLEIWNLVFMQFERKPDRSLVPLPKPSIDTGMGLERIASVLQGVNSNWDTDLFKPIIGRVVEVSGHPYDPGPGGFPHRVIADHSRAAAFLIADGVLPSNEWRGYVLRRMIRRAVRMGYQRLGLQKPFMAQVADAVIDLMGDVYPELIRNRDLIHRALTTEESRFFQALATGLNVLSGRLEAVKARGERVLSGEDAFQLYDTFGFPLDLTIEIAADEGISVDIVGFERALERQREQARAAQRFQAEQVVRVAEYRQAVAEPVQFVGYEHWAFRSKVVALFVDGRSVPVVFEGQEVEVITAETPFYGEAGGQVGDTGEILGPSGVIVVADTQRPLPDLIVHRGHVRRGEVAVGQTVELRIDGERRRDIMANHTATHLLHAALHRVLGRHALQAGSLVAPDRLRFDFSHFNPLSRSELEEIQGLVNEKIREDLPVIPKFMPFKEAIEQGAIALFGEKYGEIVRTIRIGEPPFSFELCGGTHVNHTGQVGIFWVVSESGIGSGLRRIEAVTARGAERFLRERLALLETIARRLEGSPPELERRVEALLNELNRQRKELERLQRELARREVEPLLGQVQRVDGINVLAVKVPATKVETLREVGDWVRERLGSGVIVLGAVIDNRPYFVTMVTPDLVARGLHAGQIANRVAAITGGRGGGRPHLAQAGGRDPSRIDEALRAVVELVRG